MVPSNEKEGGSYLIANDRYCFSIQSFPIFGSFNPFIFISLNRLDILDAVPTDLALKCLHHVYSPVVIVSVSPQDP